MAGGSAAWPDSTLDLSQRLRKAERAAGVGARPRLRALSAILAGALLLLAATLIVGRPGVFTDTDDYYAQGRSIARAVQKKVLQGRPIIDWARAADLTRPGGGDEEPVHNQDGARSAYYGLALYLIESLGTLWLLALVQATCAASLVYAFWRAAAPRAPQATYLALMGALATASTLPFFTSFAMPDVFAGFSALAAVLLIVYPDRFGWGAQTALFALLAAAMNFHLSNVITAAGLLAASLVVLAWFRRPPVELIKRGAILALAAVVAVGASMAYAEAVWLRSGDKLGHPPFLTARALADGPGRRYLAEACRTGRTFAVCDFKWLPLDDSEDILWSDDPSRGTFNLSDFHERQALEADDFRFALGSTLRDPLGQALASLDNWRLQTVNTRLDEPLMGPDYYLHDAYWKTTHLPHLILAAAPWCARGPGVCRPAADPEIIAVADGLAAILSGALILFRLRQARWLALAADRRFDDPITRAGLAALLLLAAVFLNALVCGALSGPFPRYQARVLWLLPAAALILEIVLRRERSSQQGD